MSDDPNPKSHLFVGALVGSILAYGVLVVLLVGVCKPLTDSASPTPASMRLPAGAPK